MPCSHGCCATNRDHWLSVTVAPSATPSRAGGARAAEVNATEKRWHEDMDAYKRLRHTGVQPRQIDGSAHLEAKASEVVEIETGQVMTTAQRRQYRQITEGVA